MGWRGWRERVLARSEYGGTLAFVMGSMSQRAACASSGMTSTAIAISSLIAIRRADFVQTRELSGWKEAVTPIHCLSAHARRDGCRAAALFNMDYVHFRIADK